MKFRKLRNKVFKEIFKESDKIKALKDLDVLSNSVRLKEESELFGYVMYCKMLKNVKDKGLSYKKMTIHQLYSLLCKEINELENSLKFKEVGTGLNKHHFITDLNCDELIDIANFCKMLYYKKKVC